MSAPAAAPAVVRLADLRVGAVLAEGGEGLVHQLPRQPHLVYKSYRNPADRSHLERLVAWPDRLTAPGAAATVRAASAWPCSVVTDDRDEALGLLMPRAPRRFAVRHRDGHSRLASLSYLTADPEHRAVAYGLSLPGPVSPERVGLVYALAQLLSAFESEDPAVGHGDLSTKNVLWSLQRGPEVFVLDCDNSERFAADGSPADPSTRRRAMTPNWDDPAVPRGHNPGRLTDRYSLGLIFLRIVGAANFPVQARQRGGDAVEIRFPVPAGSGADVLLDATAPVWRLCAASLSLRSAESRPAAVAWLRPLEELLGAMGSAETAARVRSAHGGWQPAVEPARAAPPVRPDATPTGGSAGDVVIVPEPAPRRERTWARVSPHPRYPASPEARPAPIGLRPAVAPVQPPVGDPPRVWPELKEQLLRFVRWWWSIHHTRRAAGVLLCVAVDFVIVVTGAALLALIVSPILEG